MTYHQPMDASERAHWQQVAYGRDATPEQRDHALAQLATTGETEFEPRLIGSEPDHLQRSRSRRPVLIAVGVGLTLALGAGIVALLLTREFEPPATSRPVALAPSRVSDFPGDREDENILLDPEQQDMVLRLKGMFAPERLLVAIPLGEHDGSTAYGVLTESQNVCVHFSSRGVGSATCSTLAEFPTTGVDVDRGFWGVIWNPDGSVSWYGD